MGIKVIITGATGFVGEGVLLECLEHPQIDQILIAGRRPYNKSHPKIREIIIPDFMDIEAFTEQLKGYDACFFCAGISSRGLSEKEYRYITYDITLHFAEKLASLNPGMIFNYISGAMTDSSEKGKIMWARIKGRTENALMQLPFRKVYNFRPGFIKPLNGQQNVSGFYKFIGNIFPFLRIFIPNMLIDMHDVGLAMINTVLYGYSKNILEISDMKLLTSK